VASVCSLCLVPVGMSPGLGIGERTKQTREFTHSFLGRLLSPVIDLFRRGSRRTGSGVAQDPDAPFIVGDIDIAPRVNQDVFGPVDR
jgi:hypothetical protein